MDHIKPDTMAGIRVTTAIIMIFCVDTHFWHDQYLLLVLSSLFLSFKEPQLAISLMV